MGVLPHGVSGPDNWTVLCVDPDWETAPVLDEPGVAVLTAETIGAATSILEDRAVDCLVAEYDLPDGTAFELFDTARDHQPNIGCVLFTAAGHDEMEMAAVGDSVAEYISKELSGNERRLAETVTRIIDQRSQVGFPLPPSEDERLDVLSSYDLPDLDTVEAFDRLSTLVAEYFDVSVVFIGLLEAESEQFITCHGADWEQLTREDSICTYAILEEDVTVIENVQEDPRFEHNQRLKELNVHSYAGANLTVADGTTIGELCLINDEPRSYTPAEREQLQLFADEVAEQLEFRRRLDVSQLPDDEAPEDNG